MFFSNDYLLLFDIPMPFNSVIPANAGIQGII